MLSEAPWSSSKLLIWLDSLSQHFGVLKNSIEMFQFEAQKYQLESSH